MDRPMTTADLFHKICGILKEKGLFPEILDYALAGHTPAPVTTYDYRLKNNLDYGGSEGIYLDLWTAVQTDGKEQLQKLGTFKTLKDDRDAMRVMGQLLADFIVEERAYVSAHSDDFTWEGVQVYAFDGNGERLGWSYSCTDMENALAKKDELLQKYPRVNIRDNATRKEQSYRI